MAQLTDGKTPTRESEIVAYLARRSCRRLPPVKSVAIIIGGFVNIPMKRLAHERVVPMHPLAVIGLGGLWPGIVRERRETIIAVNFRGCVVPTGLAVYELLYLSAAGAPALLALLVTAGVNVAVCHFVARPVQGVGILLPGMVRAAVAALLALIFAPGDAAPVAHAELETLPGASAEWIEKRSTASPN